MAFDPYQLPVPDLGLLCMKCQYPLGGLSEHRCPECGREFSPDDFIPAGDFPMLILDGKQVRVADEVVALLKCHGIHYIELADPLGQIYGLSAPMRSRTWLAVSRTLYFEAIDLLRRFKNGEVTVGEEEEPPADGPDWSCPGCEEQNPGNFHICWNCGKELADSA